jgi:hypothetical protein
MHGFRRIQQLPHHRRFSLNFGRVYGDRIISHGLWPACLPDRTTCDLFVE